MRIQVQNLIKLPKTLNFVLGVILISTSLVYMFTEQRLNEYENVEPLLVLVTGFLSLIVAFSTDRKIGFRINLILGCLYVVVGLALSLLFFYGIELFLNSVFGFTMQDALLNIFLGCVLLVLAYFNKKPHLKSDKLIDDYEP